MLDSADVETAAGKSDAEETMVVVIALWIGEVVTVAGFGVVVLAMSMLPVVASTEVKGSRVSSSACES